MNTLVIAKVTDESQVWDESLAQVWWWRGMATCFRTQASSSSENTRITSNFKQESHFYSWLHSSTDGDGGKRLPPSQLAVPVLRPSLISPLGPSLLGRCGGGGGGAAEGRDQGKERGGWRGGRGGTTRRTRSGRGTARSSCSPMGRAPRQQQPIASRPGKLGLCVSNTTAFFLLAPRAPTPALRYKAPQIRSARGDADVFGCRSAAHRVRTPLAPAAARATRDDVSTAPRARRSATAAADTQRCLVPALAVRDDVRHDCAAGRLCLGRRAAGASVRSTRRILPTCGGTLGWGAPQLRRGEGRGEAGVTLCAHTVRECA
eukprot:353423-Chlamydomonas_euryale.AAC.2